MRLDVSLLVAVLMPAVWGQTAPKPVVARVRNAASFTDTVARGSLATIFGTNLPTSTEAAATLPLRTLLGGTSVTLGGIAAPLIYVSPTQIYFQVPVQTPAGQSAPVVVTTSGGASAAVNVQLAEHGVGIFAYDRARAVQDPVAVHADNQLVTPPNPAVPGETVIVYATGLGRLTNPPPSGTPAPSSPLVSTTDTPALTIAGRSAKVLFAGLTPHFVGLVQFNIELPENLPTGGLALVVRTSGDTSNPVYLPVRGGAFVGVSFTPDPIAFGDVEVGRTQDVAVLIRNTSEFTVSLSWITLTRGGDFSLVGPAPSFLLAPQVTTRVTIRFAPTVAGPAADSIRVISNTLGFQSSAPISGNGIAAAPVQAASTQTLR